MAFVLGNLTAINTLQGVVSGETQNKILGYVSTDSQATVKGSGYFNNATSYLNKGDIIIASCDRGGTPTLSTLVVTSATGAATVTTAISA